MLNVETDHQHTGKSAFYFLLQAFIIVRIVAVAQHTGHCQLLRFIFNDMDSAKSNHAAEEGRVFLWLNIVLDARGTGQWQIIFLSFWQLSVEVLSPNVRIEWIKGLTPDLFWIYMRFLFWKPEIFVIETDNRLQMPCASGFCQSDSLKHVFCYLLLQKDSRDWFSLRECGDAILFHLLYNSKILRKDLETKKKSARYFHEISRWVYEIIYMMGLVSFIYLCRNLLVV